MVRLKNDNIRMYAELLVRDNKEKTWQDTVVKVLKITYYIAAAAAILTCLIMMMGFFFEMLEYKNGATADEVALYNEKRQHFITMIISVAALVGSFFLIHFKLSIPFMIVGSIDCIIIFTTFYAVSVQNIIQNDGMSSFWIMAIPSIVVAVLAIVLGIMQFVTYRLKVPKMYDKIVNDLYNSATKGGEEPISIEEFEEVLNAYHGEEIFRTDIPLKKSVRRRKEKQD